MTEQQAVPEADRDPDKRYTPDGLEVPAPSENDVLYEREDNFAWIIPVPAPPTSMWAFRTWP